MTTTEATRLAELAAKADLPFHFCDDGETSSCTDQDCNITAHTTNCDSPHRSNARANAAYIVAACNAVPGLLVERERLVEAIRDLLENKGAELDKRMCAEVLRLTEENNELRGELHELHAALRGIPRDPDEHGNATASGGYGHASNRIHVLCRRLETVEAACAAMRGPASRLVECFERFMPGDDSGLIGELKAALASDAGKGWRSPAEWERLVQAADGLEAAMDVIASWSEGPEVTISFDSPATASIARQSLAAYRAARDAKGGV